MDMLVAVLSPRLLDIELADSRSRYQCDGERWWVSDAEAPSRTEAMNTVAGLLAEARTFETYGLADKAREVYQRVIALDPTNQRAKRALSKS
jgi:hypothetical protein